jgi:hypothetical protein
MSAQSELRNELDRALAAPACRVFAVLDGASFEDLTADLVFVGLNYKPLYLDENQPGAPAAGPYLVSVYDTCSMNAVFEIMEDKAAAVWWIWPSTPENPLEDIYRHLRGLNMVEIPTDRYDAEPPDPELPEPQEPPPPYEPVLFRHGDPNAMALMLPQLDSDQISRALGSGFTILCDAPDFGSLKVFRRPPDLPPKPAGLLRLRGSQYAAIGRGRISLVEKGVAAYLREVAPDQIGGWSDEQLGTNVRTWVSESGRYGVRLEANHCRWAYLQVITGGKLNTLAEVRQAMSDRQADVDPDARVEALMEAMIQSVGAPASW